MRNPLISFNISLRSGSNEVPGYCPLRAKDLQTSRVLVLSGKWGKTCGKIKIFVMTRNKEFQYNSLTCE